MVLRAVNKKARRIVFFLGIVACLLFVCSLYWGAMTARDGDLRDANIAVQNMANALARQTNSSLRIAETVLDCVGDAAHQEMHLHSPAIGPHNVPGKATLFEEVDSVALFDSSGKVVHSWPAGDKAGWNVANEAFFIAATTQPPAKLGIASPIPSAITGNMIIPVYKSITVAGKTSVAMVGIKLSYVAALFDSFDVKEQGALVLASNDGVMLLRRPYSVQFPGKSMVDASIFRDHAARLDAGWATIVSSQDGVKRINYFQHVENYPLFVVAALSYDEVMHHWRQIATFILMLALVVAIVIALLVRFLLDLLRFKEKAERDIDIANRALAISNERLAEQALLDGLTGIANRRALDDGLRKTIQQASRSNSVIGLVMMDVDHFKRFNDSYGHIQGDMCLKDIAMVLKGMQRRQGDLAGRYGGEEFVVVLPGTDVHQAVKIANDMLRAIERLHIPHRGNAPGHVTVSAGVTSFIPGASTIPEEFYAQADRALYVAKHTGRNKVCDSNTPVPPDEDLLAEGR